MEHAYDRKEAADAECEAAEYEEFLDARELAGEPWVSMEEFLTMTRRTEARLSWPSRIECGPLS